MKLSRIWPDGSLEREFSEAEDGVDVVLTLGGIEKDPFFANQRFSLRRDGERGNTLFYDRSEDKEERNSRLRMKRDWEMYR